MGTDQPETRGQDETGTRQRRTVATTGGDVQFSKLSDDDLHRIEDRAEGLKDRFSPQGPLSRFVMDLRLLVGMARDIVRGRYKRAPGWAMVATGLAAFYALNPFDLVPDVIPLLGALDDATVVAACLLLLEQELERYRRWKTVMDE